MDVLEKSQSWKEEQFDLVLQYLRTTLLKRKLADPVVGRISLTDLRRCFVDLHKSCPGHTTTKLGPRKSRGSLSAEAHAS